MLGRTVKIVYPISPQYQQCCIANLCMILFPEWYPEEGVWGQRACSLTFWIGLAKLHPSPSNDTNIHSHQRGMRLSASSTECLPTRWASETTPLFPWAEPEGSVFTGHLHASLDLQILCCFSLSLFLLCSLAFSCSVLEGLTSLLSFTVLPFLPVYYFLWLSSDLGHVSSFLASPSPPHENARTQRAGILSFNVSCAQDSHLAQSRHCQMNCPVNDWVNNNLLICCLFFKCFLHVCHLSFTFAYGESDRIGKVNLHEFKSISSFTWGFCVLHFAYGFLTPKL